MSTPEPLRVHPCAVTDLEAYRSFWTEPTHHHRDIDGVGRPPVEHATAIARERGVSPLPARPVARTVDAVRSFHHLGFTTLGHGEVSIDLDGGRQWEEHGTLADRDFRV